MTLRTILVLAFIELLLVVDPIKAQTRRGAFALHYGPPLTATELDWYGRFDLLVTHDPLPPEQVKRLHAKGTRILFYEWSIAFYGDLAAPGSWEASLIEGESQVLLNSSALRGGVGSPIADAFYFDPASTQGRSARSRELVRRLKETGYDGVFLDTTRFESVHPDARKEYERRHPRLSYDVAYSLFLRELRHRAGPKIIVTNQGFQDLANFLPYVDWDVTESLVTHPQGEGFVPRPWNSPLDLWNSSRFLFERLIEPAMERFPRVRFAHVNYIDDRSPSSVRLAVATAHLFGGEAYVVAPSPAAEEDQIYFFDPGAPLCPRVDLREGTVSYRIFVHGVVVVNGSSSPFTLPSEISNGRRFEDLATGRVAPDGAAIVVRGNPDGTPVASLLRSVD